MIADMGLFIGFVIARYEAISRADGLFVDDFANQEICGRGDVVGRLRRAIDYNSLNIYYLLMIHIVG